MENLVGLKELRKNMDTYARKVRRGQSFIVLKQSKPLFRIVPFDSEAKDEGDWEIDFTKIRKGGIPAEELLARLRNLD